SAPLTRRGFLGAATVGVGGAWIAASWPEGVSAASHAADAVAARGRVGFRSLAPAEAVESEGRGGRLRPRQARPGAPLSRVSFIDRALETFLRDQRPLVGSGLAELRAAVAARYPGASSFAALGPAQQDAALHAIEGGDFFWMIRHATIAGFLANPSYGGNRD